MAVPPSPGAAAVLAARPARIAGSRTRSPFYLWTAAGMSGTVVVGFWFTYFGPLLQGAYPNVSPIVHAHGWTFFAWYALFTAQTGLIRAGRVGVHRALGLASIALASVMIGIGLIVSTVRIDMALGPDGDPFWAFMGLPIFMIWVLFTVFYAVAIARRRHAADHKRLMLLASAAALSAATFRIVVRIFGLNPWSAVAGTLAPGIFILAAMVHDYRGAGTVHRTYLWGGPAMMGLIAGAFALATVPGGEPLKQGLAWVGRALRPLY